MPGSATPGSQDGSSVEDVLANFEAAERVGDRLLFRSVGVLFFAKNVRRFFPQAYITCLLARGTDKVHILDRMDFDGGVVADIEDVLRFVERNTRTAYRIEGLKRENVPEYPTNALREAITNAVMHRDWFVDGANVFVEIYTDRVEVVSPGGLRLMALCSLPRTNPGNRKEYKRVNGPYMLYMTAIGNNKLPYGSSPRLLLAWVSTEAVRAQSRELILGSSLSEFMGKLAWPPLAVFARGSATRCGGFSMLMSGWSTRTSWGRPA